jgi:hypothetical protein
LSAQDNFPANDRNGDGIITRDEWNGNMRTFRTHDVNNDGMLSGNELPRGWRRADEFSRGTEPQRRAEFTRWDRNRDDVIQGAADLGVDLDEHIQFVIEAMKGSAAALGLEGLPSSASAPEGQARGG